MNLAEAKESLANTEEDLRCRGDKAADTNSDLSLHSTQHTALLDYKAKMDAYKECYHILRGLRSPIPQSLCNTVDRVMQVERKRLHQLDKCPAHVFARMDEMLQDDTKKRRKLKEEYQKAMSQAKEKYALQKKVSECKSTFKELSAEIKRIEAVAAALTNQKVYSPEMLGQGRPKGGNKEHKQNRYDVLERLRRIGNLTEEQNGQWELF